MVDSVLYKTVYDYVKFERALLKLQIWPSCCNDDMCAETCIGFSWQLCVSGCWEGWFKYWPNCSTSGICPGIWQKKPPHGPSSRPEGKWYWWQGNLCRLQTVSVCYKYTDFINLICTLIYFFLTSCFIISLASCFRISTCDILFYDHHKPL